MKTRVVLLTSFAEFRYAERAVSAHVYAYLLKPVSDEKLLQVFSELTSAVSSENTANATGKDQPVTQAVDHFAPSRKSPEELIPEIQEYIKAHLSECSRDILSSRFYLSPDYLSRIFRRVSGISLIDFIQQERMKKAKALLEERNGLSIGEIAEITGYDSFAHFSKQFRKHTGVSPNKYRKDRLK